MIFTARRNVMVFFFSRRDVRGFSLQRWFFEMNIFRVLTDAGDVDEVFRR